MASTDAMPFVLRRVNLADPNLGRSYTILVPDDVYDRVTTDDALAQTIFQAISKDMTASKMDLTPSQSVDILRGLGLLTTTNRASESEFEQSSTQDGEELSEVGGTGNDRISWCNRAVLLLVELWRSSQALFTNNCITQKQAWKKVSDQMIAKGLNYSGYDCCKKFRSMRDRYKHIKDHQGKTGRGRKQWTYFQLMEELFEKDPSVNPVRPVSSLALSLSSAMQLQQPPSPLDEQSPPATPATPLTPMSQTPPSVPKKRKRAAPTPPEPAWFAKYREEEQSRHEERMEVEKKRMEMENKRMEMENKKMEMENKKMEMENMRLQLETRRVQALETLATTAQKDKA